MNSNFQHSDQVRSCLENLDIVTMRNLWGEIAPHLPLPNSDNGMLIAMHHARTQANSIPLKKRAYSHRWLLDHGFPSGLPDKLKPRAERIYPKIVSAVGIAVKTNGVFAAAGPLIQEAMEDAVKEAVADGRLEDAEYVKQRIQEARQGAVQKLLGIRG